MGHITRTIDVPTLTQHLGTILAQHRFDMDQSELTLVPGSWPKTGDTVGNILTALQVLDPALPQQVQFRHYPAEEFPLNGAIIAYGGQLSCLLLNSQKSLFSPGVLGKERFVL